MKRAGVPDRVLSDSRSSIPTLSTKTTPPDNDESVDDNVPCEVAPPRGEGAAGTMGAGLAPNTTSNERGMLVEDMMHRTKELET
jgi:hypothetical protein